jgi:ubiquinone/menaquinone biosynthesis C-methylase UbiE
VGREREKMMRKPRTLASLFPGGHFEPPAWIYNLMARGALARRIYRRFVADLVVSLPAGVRLLDVGTGPGYLLRYLARERSDVHLWGLDMDFKMITLAPRGNPLPTSLAWVVSDVQALPFPDETFHQIIATFSYHTWSDPIAGLQEIRRTLKPGGRAWIYEMKQEATAADLRSFAQEERIPFPLVYLGFKAVCWGHALRREDFAGALEQVGRPGWRLSQAHYLFWRGELER